jgi:hypothetical protein
MALKESKRKYDDEEDRVSTATAVMTPPPHRRGRYLPRRNPPGHPAPMTVTPSTRRTMMATTMKMMTTMMRAMTMMMTAMISALTTPSIS